MSFDIPIRRPSSQVAPSISLKDVGLTSRGKKIFQLVRLSMAARKIQRLFRAHITQKRTQAAHTLQRFFKSVKAIKDSRLITRKLVKLRDLESRFTILADSHSRVFSIPLAFRQSGEFIQGLENKPYLLFEDGLEKLLCELDIVSGMDLVKERRRGLVIAIGSVLKQLDEYNDAQRIIFLESIAPPIAPIMEASIIKDNR